MTTQRVDSICATLLGSQRRSEVAEPAAKALKTGQGPSFYGSAVVR